MIQNIKTIKKGKEESTQRNKNYLCQQVIADTLRSGTWQIAMTANIKAQHSETFTIQTLIKQQ